MYNTMYNIKIFLNQIEIKTEKKKIINTIIQIKFIAIIID